ncbi:hypothetical protein BH24ACI4_BH24ACI4_09480 [soil metagenome]
MTTVMLAQLTVMLPHAQTPPANAEASNAIASLTQRLADATGTAGKDLLASLLADDYVRVAPNGTFVGKAQVLSAPGTIQRGPVRLAEDFHLRQRCRRNRCCGV